MRVHGNIKISRRANIKSQKDYEKYRDELREDFGYICGYCGKSEHSTTKGFEIDHFVPKKAAPERELDYYNLVYSCFTCNRKKWGKWPTRDPNIPNDGCIGLIDPASSGFDSHLHRTSSGDIEGITNVGKYMCRKIFKFHLRPMRELWYFDEMLRRKEFIKSRLKSLSSEQKDEYIEIDEQLEELRKLLFNKKE